MLLICEETSGVKCLVMFTFLFSYFLHMFDNSICFFAFFNVFIQILLLFLAMDEVNLPKLRSISNNIDS